MCLSFDTAPYSFVDCIIQPGELLQTDKRLHKYHSQYIHLG